jgi:hypothetical protein
MPRILVAVAIVLIFSSAAAAQSIYAAGAVGADISLVSGQESFGIPSTTGGGEALSGAARVGVVLDGRFGVEFELSRAAELRDESRPGINPLAALFPIFVPEIETRTRITTISTTASIRQQVSDRIALAYLGGIVFHRTDSRLDYRAIRGIPVAGATVGLDRVTFTTGGLEPIFPVGLSLPSFNVDGVRYGVGPVVGMEAHIGYGDHITIIPGVRMHGLPATWLIRPSVGVGWTF